MTEDERFARVLATRSIIVWPSAVFIPYDEDTWEQRSRELDQWLYDNIGRFGIDWSIDYTNSGARYKFKNPEHLTLFALSWL